MFSEQLFYFIEQLNILLKQEGYDTKVSVDYDLKEEDDILQIAFLYYVDNEVRFKEKVLVPLDYHKAKEEEILKQLNDDFYRNLIMRTEFLQKKDILQLEHYQLN